MTYPELVSALSKPGEDIIKGMTPLGAHQLHMAIGIAGEAGELIDAVKKHVIYEQQIDLENVIEELGDLEFYMEGLRQGMGITRTECLVKNMAKLLKRYGEKYCNQAAKDRKDKQP
jgi:NTP pyrophosphatase (non-canonical NTP hydrolase)